MFTTIAISLVWLHLVTFSNGQKATPFINTQYSDNNVSGNLSKWHAANANEVSTSITPVKSNNNKTTILHFATQTQKPKQQQNQLSAEHNMTASYSNASMMTRPLHNNSNSTSNHSSSPSKTFENNSNNVTISGLSSNLTHAPSTYHYNYNNSTKSISISIDSSQNIVNSKGTSTVKAIANDAATGKKIENAIVKLTINFPSNGTSKKIVGHNGEVTYSVELKPNSSSNNNLSFKATVEASAPGYNSTSKSTTTSSSSMSTSTSSVTSNSNNQTSIINSSSDTANLT